MAQFSNTATKDGLIQRVEFWTRLPDATISGNATLLLQITSRINTAFERIMPLLLSYSDHMRWDDLNHTDAPIGRTNIVSGQADYKMTTDGNALDILNITNVRVLPSATATIYEDLRRMKADDSRVTDAVSPNTNNTGSPSHFLELGNRLYLYPEPNYAATSGLEVFFGREQSVFTNADTTKEAGIPKVFHELLALYPAYDYVAVNRPDEGNTLTIIKTEIDRIETDLRNFISLRHPTQLKIEPGRIKFR
ncbi:MAG TPA: hypothetical protein ENI23_11205 [bacterium]|nr:hypothetical protein [bacterium]